MRPLLALAAALTLAVPAPAQDTARLDAQMRAAMQAQRYDQVITVARQILDQNPKHEQAWFNLGYALHASGELGEALAAHEKASEYPTVGAIASYNAACVYALQGKPDDAIAWLRKATAKGFDQLQQVEIDSDLDSLRGDPRFEEIVAALGGKPGGKAGDGRGAPPAGVRVFGGTTDRKSTRLFYWSGTASPGQVVLDYGPVAWKEQYAAAADSEQLVGKRWRLGNNFWTVLDTNLALKISGVAVPAGIYYVTLEKSPAGTFRLALNDPAAIQARKLDAFQAELTSGGIEIPLEHSMTDDVAGTLAIELASKAGGDPRDATLTIRFGPHALTADVETILN